MPKPSPRILALALVAAAFGAAACGEVEESSSSSSDDPAHLEPIEGSSFKRVVLVPRAVERLGIKTAEVRPASPQEKEGLGAVNLPGRNAIPFEAVLYDKTGAPFTYTNPKEREYVRHAITLDGIKNNVAVMSAGPPPGAWVVTVGGIELYGAETGVGK
jgi:hypothetical protein